MFFLKNKVFVLLPQYFISVTPTLSMAPTISPNFLHSWVYYWRHWHHGEMALYISSISYFKVIWEYNLQKTKTLHLTKMNPVTETYEKKNPYLISLPFYFLTKI